MLLGRFTRSYPYPSFDVWDLDTVDRGVSKHLYQELDSPQDWDVFIGHYLGVDHAGHKFGPNHPEMARKLDEMNDVIATVSKFSYKNIFGCNILSPVFSNFCDFLNLDQYKLNPTPPEVLS